MYLKEIYKCYLIYKTQQFHTSELKHCRFCGRQGKNTLLLSKDYFSKKYVIEIIAMSSLFFLTRNIMKFLQKKLFWPY